MTTTATKSVTPNPTIAQILELQSKGFEVCIVPAFRTYHRTETSNFSRSWSAGMEVPPGNLVVRHPNMFSLVADARVYPWGLAAMMAFGQTMTVKLGETVTAVYRYNQHDGRVFEGVIPGGNLLGVQVVKSGFHLPPTAIFENGTVEAEFLADCEPALIPATLCAELRRWGFYIGE
jgi:hypothetical protein